MTGIGIIVSAFLVIMGMASNMGGLVVFGVVIAAVTLTGMLQPHRKQLQDSDDDDEYEDEE